MNQRTDRLKDVRISAAAALIALLLLNVPTIGRPQPDPISGGQIEGRLQSTTGPVPPPGIDLRGHVFGGIRIQAATVIPGVPTYTWRHGCGPTAIGMVIGYYDAHGYDGLIPGDPSVQGAAVNAAIASQGNYDDYCLPLDYSTSGPILPDRSELPAGDEHADNSIADFMDTSQSVRYNYYGWAWDSDVSPGFRGYIALTGAGEGTTWAFNFSSFDWDSLKYEIDNLRPLVFLVDTDGNNSTDHFVTVVGYNSDAGVDYYGCYNTWDQAIHWYEFRAMGSGIPWGVSMIHTFSMSAAVQWGSLKVTLSPAAAVAAGAKWNVDSGPWQNSEMTVMGLSVGDHAVSYKSVSGYAAPAGETVAIVNGQTEQLTKTYAPAISAAERNALMALYNSTNGDNWTNNLGWKTPPLHTDGFAMPGSEGAWYGVGEATFQELHAVASLSLSNNNLQGSIPPELGVLQYAYILNLAGNQLSGTIPAELGSVGSMKGSFAFEDQFIDLSSNQLSGPIPPEMGSFHGEGEVNIDLSSNALSGSIPPELGSLGSYHFLRLDLSSNQLSGSIPLGLGNLYAQDVTLDLSSNQLSGSIPTDLDNIFCSFLVLDLSSNQLSGPIPPEFDFQTLGYRVTLDLSSNQLSGSIPPELFTMFVYLGLNLDIRSNQLSGLIPSEVVKEGVGSLLLGYNALFADDPDLIAFLNSKDLDWASTQTIAPTGVTATSLDNAVITVSWLPVAYTADAGLYNVYMSQTVGGPYALAGSTTDKATTSLNITGLTPAERYYFVVRTQTNAHANNTSIVESTDSLEVTAIAWTQISVQIAGTVTLGGSPLAGVVMNGLTGSPVTNASGVYTGTEAVGWTGTVTPTLAGYTFFPVYRTYTAPVTSDLAADDFTASVIAPGDENWDGQFGANGLNGYVRAIAVSGTDVYVGGQFTQAGGNPANNIAKWDTITSTWSALGSGMNTLVYAIAVSGSDVYVGGLFTDAGGVPANYIAKWDTVTSTWSALGSGLNGYVRAIAVSGTDVYVGGNFTQAGGSSANYIAKWNGTSWTALGSGTSGRVYTIAVSGADVYVGGSFLTAGGLTVQRIAKWNGTSGWSDLGGGVTGGAVYAIAFLGPNVYVAGDFSNVGTGRMGFLAIWNGATGWSEPPSWPSNYIDAMAVSGTDVYVGQWDTLGETVRKLDTVSATWSMLGSGLGPEGESPWVYAVAATGTDVYVGGKFTTAGGKSSYYFGRWMIPLVRAVKVDFNKDGHEDLLWRYYGAGGYNRAWFLAGTEGAEPLLTASDPRIGAGLSGSRKRSRKMSLSDPREIGLIKKEVAGTEDLRVLMGGKDKAAVDDPRRAGDVGVVSLLPPIGIADPRHVRLVLEKATDDTAKVASAPVLLGGADVMAVNDLNWQIVGTGDFNNDTYVDILWRNISSGTNVVWYMNGTEWAGSAELLRVGDLTWQIVGTGDFNKDTHVDILWRNVSNGTNVVWLMNGTTWISSAVLLGVSDVTWQIVGTGDFNKDGKVDILWRYGGAGGYNVVWYMNNAGWTGSAELISVGDPAWQILGTGDYDGDENVDILWRYNGAGGYNVIWYMNGVNWSSSAELIPVPDLAWKIVSR